MEEKIQSSCLVLQVTSKEDAEPEKTENIIKPPQTKRVTVQEISSVDVPYFDMSLSESGMSESETDEANESKKEIEENIDSVSIDKNNINNSDINEQDSESYNSKLQQQAARNASAAWANLRNKGEITLQTAENSNNVKKYDRENIRGAYAKDVKEERCEETEETELAKNIPEEISVKKEVVDDVPVVEKHKKDVCYIEDLAFDDEELEEEENRKKKRKGKRKNRSDDDSDFNPEECADECSSDWESENSDDCDDLYAPEDDTLVSLEGTRYNNFDESITCILCSTSHSSRSQCKIYSTESHKIIPDPTSEKGEVLYDYESLPQILRFTDSDDFSNGVCADVNIEPLTRFGPLIAEDFMIYTLGFDNNLADVWLLIENGDQFKALTTNENVRSNWFRYVLPSNGPRSANTLAVTIDKKLYLITIKSIAANEELRYWQDEHRDLSRWSILQSRRGLVKQSCGMAHAKFPSRHHYRMHMILFHNFKSKGMLQKHYYYCHVCNGPFFRKEALCTHCQVDHGGIKPFKCYLCGRLILRASMVRTHVRECGKNSNAIRFPCPECGKLFVRDFYLKRHIATVHLGLREYTCEFCGLQFATDRSVRRHINAVHNGEQPHICDKCGRRFSQGSNLKVHLLTHSGVKPFQCQENDCTAGFTTKQCLQFHYLRVHKYTNENIPEIQRVVPFTYEDHSLNVGDEQSEEGNISRVSKKRKKRDIVISDNDYDDDEESDWDEKPKRRKRRKRVQNKKKSTEIIPKKRRGRKNVSVTKIIKPEDIKIEINDDNDNDNKKEEGEVEDKIICMKRKQNGVNEKVVEQLEVKANNSGRKNVVANKNKKGKRRRKRRGKKY